MAARPARCVALDRASSASSCSRAIRRSALQLGRWLPRILVARSRGRSGAGTGLGAAVGFLLLGWFAGDLEPIKLSRCSLQSCAGASCCARSVRGAGAICRADPRRTGATTPMNSIRRGPDRARSHGLAEDLRPSPSRRASDPSADSRARTRGGCVLLVTVPFWAYLAFMRVAVFQLIDAGNPGIIIAPPHLRLLQHALLLPVLLLFYRWAIAIGWSSRAARARAAGAQPAWRCCSRCWRVPCCWCWSPPSRANGR